VSMTCQCAAGSSLPRWIVSPSDVSVCNVPSRRLRLGSVGVSIVLDYYGCGVVGWAILRKQYGLAKSCHELKYVFCQGEMDGFHVLKIIIELNGNVQFKLQISAFK